MAEGDAACCAALLRRAPHYRSPQRWNISIAFISASTGLFVVKGQALPNWGRQRCGPRCASSFERYPMTGQRWRACRRTARSYAAWRRVGWRGETAGMRRHIRHAGAHGRQQTLLAWRPPCLLGAGRCGASGAFVCSACGMRAARVAWAWPFGSIEWRRAFGLRASLLSFLPFTLRAPTQEGACHCRTLPLAIAWRLLAHDHAAAGARRWTSVQLRGTRCVGYIAIPNR